jgi:hypothetical protein
VTESANHRLVGYSASSVPRTIDRGTPDLRSRRVRRTTLGLFASEEPDMTLLAARTPGWRPLQAVLGLAGPSPGVVDEGAAQADRDGEGRR